MKRTNKSIYPILGILSSGPKSGYDIKKIIERSTGHFWAESYGQIYPTLNMLVKDGLLYAIRHPENKKPNRKLYYIAQSGLNELEKWLAQPVESISLGRNELLLKLFFGNKGDVETSIKHIMEYKDKIEKQLQLYNSIESMLSETINSCSSALYRSLTLRHGMAICNAQIKWCDESVKLLNNEKLNDTIQGS